jgi:hypothetical protein
MVFACEESSKWGEDLSGRWLLRCECLGLLPLHDPFFLFASGVVLLAAFVPSIFSSPRTLLAAINL